MVDGHFVRSVRLQFAGTEIEGWIRIESLPQLACLRLWHSSSLAPVREALLRAVRRQFAGRIARNFGNPIQTAHGQVDRVFPSAARIAALAPDQLSALGIIGTRARSIIALAAAVSSGALVFDAAAEIELSLIHI